MSKSETRVSNVTLLDKGLFDPQPTKLGTGAQPKNSAKKRKVIFPTGNQKIILN